MSNDADGRVVIDVQLLLKNTMDNLKKVDELTKNIGISESVDKQVEGLDKATANAAKSADKLTDSVKNTGKALDKEKKSADDVSHSSDSNSKSKEKEAKEYERLQNRLKLTAASYKTLSEANEKLGNKYQASLNKLDSYKTQLEATQKAMVKQRTQLDEVTKAYGENSDQAKMASIKLQSLDANQQKLVASAQALYKKYGSLTPEMAKVADQANMTGKRIKGIGDGMTSAGNSMSTRFTLPIVTGMGLATKASMDFQYQLQDIRKEVVAQGYSSQEVTAIMSQLSTETLKWSKQFGVGTKEINEGMFELVSNGYNVKQAMGMMPELLKTMTANSDKTGTSIKLTASMLEQFGMNLGSNGQVIKNGNILMNQMTEATHKSAMSLGDLQQISGNAGAAMHAMGISTADFLATAGRLKSAGIDASSVGTGLSSLMTRIGTGTGQAADDLKKYNIQVFDSNGKMKSLFNILGQMQGAYKGMNEEEQQKFMYDVVGQENMKVGMTLMNAELGRYRSLSDEIEHSNGTVNKYNNTMRDTAQFSQQQFLSSLHALEVEFGQKLLPILTPIIKDLTGMINKFSELDAGTQKQIITSAALLATVGPGLSILGKLNSGIGSFLMTGPNVLKFLSDAKNGTLMMSDAEKTATLIAEKLNIGTKAVGKGTEAMAEKTIESTNKTGLFRRALTGLIPALGGTGAGLSSLILPAAGVVAGIAAVGTITYFAIKAHNEHEKKLAEYKKTLNEFGVNVSANTQKVMKSFNNLRQSATNDMMKLDNSTKDQSLKLSKSVVLKYDRMTKMVTSGFDKMKNESEKSIKSLNSDLGAIGDNLTNTVLNHVDKVTNSSTAKVKEAKATIHKIYMDVNGDLSQMSSLQRSQFEDAQNYIAEQTSAFAISLKDQQALLNAYKSQHGNITGQMYLEDVKAQKKAYSETSKTADDERKKEIASLKKSHREHLITDEQYQQESSVAQFKYNNEMAKSNISYANSQDALYKHFKNTGTEFLKDKKSINEVSTKLDEYGQKVYKSVTNDQYVTREQWINQTKDANKRYIAEQKNAHGTVKDNQDKFYKNSVQFYKKMGLSREEAIVQAKVDRKELENETDKQASNMAVDSEKIQESYFKGLQSNKFGSTAQVAKQWGLDLSNNVKNINLGKYGTKSAQEFWDDFNSGSVKGKKEAEVYFQGFFQDLEMDSKTHIRDLSDTDKSELHAGLESGIISLKDLKGQFHKTVLELFPKDMSQVPDQEIQSLKSAYQNNIVSLDSLKKHFGDKIYQLFPDDLSKLGKKEVSTLEDGLKNNSIKSDELKAKYGAQLQSIFTKDLSDVGKSDLETLHNAVAVGLTNPEEIKQNFSATLDRIYNQTPKLNDISNANMATLRKAIKAGITNPQEIENKYKAQLDSIYDQNLTGLGKNQIKTLTNGLRLGIPEAQDEMKRLQTAINKGATVDLKGKGKVNIDGLVQGFEQGKISISTFMSKLQKLVKKSAELNLNGEGSRTIGSYGTGISNNTEAATSAADNARSKTEANLTPTGQPYNHGSGVTQGFSDGIMSIINSPLSSATTVHDQSVAQFSPTSVANGHGKSLSQAFGDGIITNGGIPLKASAAIDTGVNNNFNDGIDSAININTQLDGKSNYKKHTSKTTTSMGTIINGGIPYKTGTNGKLTSQTPSIVGDGYEPELIDYGNGQLELSPAVPTFRMLNPGAQVFSGHDTKTIKSAMDAFGIPMFAQGSGSDVGEWISNTAKTSWDWIKNSVGDLIDWISHPKETWSKLVDNQFDMSPFTGNSDGIGSGAKETEKKQTGWLDKLVKDLMSTGGSYDPAMILKAAAVMGVHPSDSFIKMLQGVIQSESGGKSVVQTVHDQNSGGNEAAGILQYTPGTFRAFAMPGHTNRMSPFDELLAFFNNSDWQNSIGPTVIWGVPKIDWLHSGPQGHRRMNTGGHVYQPETIDVAEEGQDEFVINPHQSTASKLTSDLLKRISDVNPTAFEKIVLPGAGVTPESISGFKTQPLTQAQAVQQQNTNSTSNNADSQNMIAGVIDKMNSLIDAMSGDATIEVNVDGSTLATATFPKTKLMLNDYIRAEMTRKGR
ncbi:phage tail tape measure protein [Companilactobacillus muriivasis]|uniref:phage tail tape measure protein n=1 Tax=Companilactobacillus muriivasis TaxID=3081444 RepID=UPI0030C671A7